jgi:hypothetical protein
MTITVASYNMSSVGKLKNAQQKKAGLAPKVFGFDSSEYCICDEEDYLEIVSVKPLRIEWEKSSCELFVYHTESCWDRIAGDIPILYALWRSLDSKFKV